MNRDSRRDDRHDAARDHMSIGDFARRTGLTVSALRFYAGRAVLSPADTDPSSGYRRYAEDQVGTGRLLRDLRRIGMPLVEIRAALDADPAERRVLVERHLARLEHDVRRAHRVARTLGVAPHEPRTEPDPMTTNPTTPNPDPTPPASVRLGPNDLATAITQVLPAAASDGTRPHLMTVLVERMDSALRLVATDGHRLAVRDLATDQGDPASAVVAAGELCRWPEALAAVGAATTDLTIDDRGVRVDGLDPDLGLRPVPVTFPDYEPFLEARAGDTTVVVDRDALLSALESAATSVPETDVSADTGSDAGSEPEIVIAASGATEAAVGATTLGAEVDGPAVTTTLNLRYVLDAVRGAIGPEVVIEIGDQTDPVVFRSADDGTYTCRIMPILVD